MKAMYFFLATVALASACNGPLKHDDVKTSLPGVYTFEGKDEFSEASDTLIITAYDVYAGTYTVTRKTGYNRIIDGKIAPREYKSVEMMTVYNEENKQLKEEKTGKFFSFAEGKKDLLFGSAIYKKIK